MIVSGDITAFQSTQVEEAREAFDLVCPDVRRFVERYLRDLGIEAGEWDDLTQQTLVRLWNARSSIENRGVGAWWCLVKKTADRLIIDQSRRRVAPSVSDDVLSEIPDREERFVHAIAESAAMKDGIRQAADACWLGEIDPEPSPVAMLAATLLYVDHVPFTEVCDLLQIADPEAVDELERTLGLRPVVMRSARQALYWSNERLAAELLRRIEADPPEAEESWGRDAVLLRYRNGLTAEQIVRVVGCHSSAASLERLVGEYAAYLPFLDAARRLVASTRRCDCLAGAGLWRRLVFEYWLTDQIPQRQILERTGAAAEVAGFRLTAGMLNVWIGNSRLLSQLAAFLEERIG